MVRSLPAGEDPGDGRSDGVTGSVEISARYEALDWASRQFGRTFVDIGDVQRAAGPALALAAEAAGDATTSAAISALSGRVTAALDDACSRMLDLAGGLRAAIETYQNADQAVATAADSTEGPGRPR
jgi:hypothetical protein